ncbi:MAG: group III truncated hemoglobin [Bacteroidia bacterium]|nr:group III truncated hemoglobin [Bacteroidia bacterium]
MLNDIRTEEDLTQLVRTFYESAIKDEKIGHYFTEVVQLDFDHHIPRIVNFWNTILFLKGDYKGNPIIKHIELHQKESLDKSHFDHWTKLWCANVDRQFSGPNAEICKEKATTISQLMAFKVQASNQNGFIQ